MQHGSQPLGAQAKAARVRLSIIVYFAEIIHTISLTFHASQLQRKQKMRMHMRRSRVQTRALV
jgi:hypothetical protein